MPRKPRWPPPIYTEARTGKSYVRLRFNGTKQDITLGPAGSEEARAAYLRVVAQVEAGGGLPKPRSASELTVAEVCSRFLRHADAAYDDAGREPVQFRLAVGPLLSLYGPTPAADFGPRSLKAVQQAMIRRGWSRRYLNRHVTRIKTLWKWAESEELLPKGSYHALTTVRGLSRNAPGVRHLPDRKPSRLADLKRLRPHCPPAVYAMLLLGYWSGMRPGELRRMRTADVDRSGDVWLYVPDRHKTEHLGQRRVVPLGPRCRAILSPWLRDDDPDGYVFRPLACRRFRGRPDRYKECGYTRDGFTEAVDRACKKAGVKLVAYQGRHAAKARITRAAGMDAARQVLGQRSIDSTAQYAAGVDLESAIETARRLS